MKISKLRVLLFLPLAALVACKSTSVERGQRGDVTSRFESNLPWTQAFSDPAVIVADRILIEGPADLIHHIAVRHDSETSELEQTTVPEGMLQVMTVKPNMQGQLHALLDELEIIATAKLEILQRPGDVPVRVRAYGNAYWSTADESQSKRSESIELVGERGK